MGNKFAKSRFFNAYIGNLSIFKKIYLVIEREVKDFFIQLQNFQEKIKIGIETDNWNHFKEDNQKEYVGVPLDEITHFYDFSKDITYENLIKFEDRSYLLFLYSEMEHYLFKCLKFIILKNPKIMNKKSVTIETLLTRRNNIELILEEKAEKIIHDLFYKNFDDFFDFCHKFLGIKHKIKKQDIETLNELKLLRNAYIHGDGTVSLIYLSKKPDSSSKLGEKLSINTKILFKYNAHVLEILKEFDKVVIKQFPEVITKNK